MRAHEFANRDAMPLFGLGTWKSEPGEVHAAVNEAVRLGYRHVDCSPIYANEPEVGAALAECFAGGLAAREDVWVTSKLWNDSHAPGDVIPALETTLADLRLAYLDLYLVHWPVAQRKGVLFPETGADLVSLDEIPLASTWHDMEEAVDRGLCRHIGVSNFSAAKIDGLLDGARIRPEVDQVEMHPYLQQNALVEFCRASGVLVTAYAPLGSADRPDRLRVDGEPILLDDPVVLDIAGGLGVTAAQVLIAWALQRGTAVIPKTGTPARLAENLAGSQLELDAESLARIAGLDRHRRYIPGDFWAKPGSPYTVADLWDEPITT